MLAAVLPVEEHVRRLHVAMDEPAGVSSVERRGDLRHDRDCAGGGESVLVAKKVPEVTVDVAHGKEEASLRLPRLVDRDDVRVVERRGQS